MIIIICKLFLFKLEKFFIYNFGEALARLITEKLQRSLQIFQQIHVAES